MKVASRTSLLRANLPDYLWAEAAATATYALDRAPSPRDSTKTRFELYWGYKPDVSNRRTLGQYASVLINDRTRTWSEKATLARFVGYTESFNTYRMYFEDTKMIRQVCNIRWLPVSYTPTKQDRAIEPMELDTTTENHLS